MPSPAYEEAFSQAKAHLEGGRIDEAFAALHPFEGEAKEDRLVALGMISLWRTVPGRPGLVRAVEALAESYPGDPEVVTLACDVLIREGERLAPDVPPPAEGAAHTVVKLAQRGLEQLPEQLREDPRTMAYLQICLGNGLRLAHLYDRAHAAMKSALAKMPDQGHWWYNLGLLDKQRREFAEGLDASRKARELLGDQKQVLWNLAICATACGDGKAAAEAFGILGIGAYVADSGMPQVDNMPPVQVRVATIGPGHMGPSALPDNAVGFELVWVVPFSPCHGVVQTPTYREGSVDFGDVILWDAVPVGVAEFNGQKTPRFPLLAVLHKGDEHRFRFIALERTRGALDNLAGELPVGGMLFVHRERVEQGPKVPEAATEDAGSPEAIYGKLVLPAAMDLSRYRQALEQFLASQPVELVVPELLEKVGDTAAAGKAHTMWRGIERTVEKTKQS